MANEKPGYVYILTNPSFREDWVKIGKSARPVDVRSKELDNTAVPLPFEIYATMKTVKYNEAERLVHKYIERFTNLRIRNNREFFNVKPEEAFEIFKDVSMVIDDVEIVVYDKEASKKEECQSSDKPKDKGHQFNLGYWEAFVEYMEKNPSELFHTHKPSYDHWMNIAIGRSGTTIALLLDKRKERASIQLYNHNDEDKKIFDALELYKEPAEASIGKKMDWRRIDGKKASSIDLYFDNCGIKDPANWNKIFAWYKEYTEKYIEFFKPILKTL